MAKAQSNGIEIEYETFGSSSSPALLLIAGLGVQLIGWESSFCGKLADQGFYVIRFDNRDIGLSTKCDGLSMQEITKKMFALFMGKREQVPYSIDDMADDAAGLLDFLDIRKAHVCGISMGGFIAQTLAVNHPDRMSSLTSVYSHTGDNRSFQPAKEAMDAMLAPAPAHRDGYIEHMTRFFELVHGNGLQFDEEFHRDLAASSYDRSFYPEGIARQYLAILTQKKRTKTLGDLKVPSLVIHGDDDPLVPLSGGEATAQAIPGSQFKIVKGMGHAMPCMNLWWSDILDAITEHMNRSAGV
ncbi:MAG: alpha/beta fold hydrolase [Desulfamplus sp.]|nr:alpha/beta fold hydrolase [Desulfamplus sp.]